MRVHGRVIDIPKRPNSAYATYAVKDVVVKHLLSGDYRVFYNRGVHRMGERLTTETFNRWQHEQGQERRRGVTFSQSTYGVTFSLCFDRQSFILLTRILLFDLQREQVAPNSSRGVVCSPLSRAIGA